MKHVSTPVITACDPPDAKRLELVPEKDNVMTPWRMRATIVSACSCIRVGLSLEVIEEAAQNESACQSR